MAARGFCGDGSQKPYFDIRVFNPCAQTYLTMEPHIIGSAEALPILCVSDFCESQRERERERETPMTSLISR